MEFECSRVSKATAGSVYPWTSLNSPAPTIAQKQGVRTTNRRPQVRLLLGTPEVLFLGVSGLYHLFYIKHHSLLKFSLPKMYICINDIFQFFPFFLPFFLFFVSCFVFLFRLRLSSTSEFGDILKKAEECHQIFLMGIISSPIVEMYYWKFNQSSSLKSFEQNKNHCAELIGAQISADQKYFVIEDQGKFLAENLTSELSGENGFTVSFSARQTGRLDGCHFIPCQVERHLCIPKKTSKFF